MCVFVHMSKLIKSVILWSSSMGVRWWIYRERWQNITFGRVLPCEAEHKKHPIEQTELRSSKFRNTPQPSTSQAKPIFFLMMKAAARCNFSTCKTISSISPPATYTQTPYKLLWTLLLFSRIVALLLLAILGNQHHFFAHHPSLISLFSL